MKISVAYPQSTDAALREKIADQCFKLAESYREAARLAMERQDAEATFEAVKEARAFTTKAFRIEKGFVRF